MSFAGGPVKMNLLSNGQNQVLDGLSSQVAGAIGNAGPIYGGQRVADGNNMMDMAFGGVKEGFGNAAGMAQGLGQQLSGLGDMQGLQNMFQSQLGGARDAFREQLDQLKGQYGSTAGRGGAFDKAMGQAVGDFGANQTNMLGQMVMQDRQGAMNRQGQALNAGVNMQAMDQNGLSQMFGMGQAKRGMDQEQIAAKKGMWDEGQWYNNPALNFTGAVLGTNSHGIGQEPGVGSAVGSLLGGAGQLFQGMKGG